MPHRRGVAVRASTTITFVGLKQGIKQVDFMVQRLDDGTWALLEVRTDGITLTRDTWGAEPSYSAARAAVVAALRGGMRWHAGI